MEDAGIPRQRAARAAHTRLDGARHDLVERRITRERVGQSARLSGVRAAKLDRRRGTAAHAVPGVEIEIAGRAERHARRGIQPAVRVFTIERARTAAWIEIVEIADARPVETG